MSNDKATAKEPKLTVNVGVEETPATPVASVEEKEVNDINSFEKLIREKATEEDAPVTSSTLSFRRIIGGDILTAEIVRKQIYLFLLITGFMIVYIAERYSYEKYLTEIATLSAQLDDAKRKALSSKSELTECTRQSKVLDMLKINKDSLLQIANQPPYIIQLPE